MGSCNSKQADHDDRNTAVVSLPNQSKDLGLSQRMQDETRKEFLRIVNDALRDRSYMVIGGSALAEYGSLRETADVDVLVGDGCSRDSAENLLIRRSNGRLIRLEEKRIGFRAQNGQLYQLDLSSDIDADLPFNRLQDSRVVNGIKLATIEFLLNSKAHAWQTRVQFVAGFNQKRTNDAKDIKFCLKLLRGWHGIPRNRLKWVYQRTFWQPFLKEHPDARLLFEGAGITDLETSDNVSLSSGSLSSRSTLSDMSSFHSPPRRSSSGQGNVQSFQWSRQSSQYSRYSSQEGTATSQSRPR